MGQDFNVANRSSFEVITKTQERFLALPLRSTLVLRHDEPSGLYLHGSVCRRFLDQLYLYRVRSLRLNFALAQFQSFRLRELFYSLVLVPTAVQVLDYIL